GCSCFGKRDWSPASSGVISMCCRATGSVAAERPVESCVRCKQPPCRCGRLPGSTKCTSAADPCVRDEDQPAQPEALVVFDRQRCPGGARGHHPTVASGSASQIPNSSTPLRP